MIKEKKIIYFSSSTKVTILFLAPKRNIKSYYTIQINRNKQYDISKRNKISTIKENISKQRASLLAKKIQAEYFPDFFNSQEAPATNFPVEKESYR